MILDQCAAELAFLRGGMPSVQQHVLMAIMLRLTLLAEFYTYLLTNPPEASHLNKDEIQELNARTDSLVHEITLVVSSRSTQLVH